MRLWGESGRYERKKYGDVLTAYLEWHFSKHEKAPEALPGA